jgi:hypothetical protein
MKRDFPIIRKPNDPAQIILRMKCTITMTVCLAGLALLNTGASAQDVALTGYPYATIATHNIFHLSPVVATSAVPQVKSPPPKITATGIMSVFGQWQVLFKVNHSSEASQPAKANSYILGEREQKDNIEVIHIDGQAGVVTFNNHGVLQEVSLTDYPAGCPLVPATVALAPVRNLHPASFENSRTPDYLGGGANAVQNGQPYQNTTAEQRILLIEAQRAYLKSRDDPAADLLPPTALTPPE